MKRKTNVSVQDNRGIRRKVNMLVGDAHEGFRSGDILDANSVVALIKAFIGGGGGGTVTSSDIVNGTILLEDLADEVVDKMESEYEEGEEALYLNGSRANN